LIAVLEDGHDASVGTIANTVATFTAFLKSDILVVSAFVGCNAHRNTIGIIDNCRGFHGGAGFEFAMHVAPFVWVGHAKRGLKIDAVFDAFYTVASYFALVK